MKTKNRSTIASLFVIIISLFPSLGKKLWKKWYDFLANQDNENNFLFMNYGYHNSEEELSLLKEDEVNRYQIQLYESVLTDLDLNNKNLLEVGSGRGGGLDYISRYKNLSSLTGIDLSSKAISKATNSFSRSNINFVNASADNIPLDDNSIDVIINVESSHCYPNMDDFIRETFRVLKPGGYFAICDIRNQSGVDNMELSFKKCGYTLLKKNNITDNVLQALGLMSDDRIKISDRMPSFLKKAFLDFAGVKSSSVFDLLKNNKLIYISYLLRKN